MNLKKLILTGSILMGVSVFSATLKDGEYTVNSEYGKHGWKHSHTIIVKDGKIVKSLIIHTNEKNENKADDFKYNESMKKRTGVSFNEAVEKMNNDFVAKQSANIDDIAGASHTLEDFKKSSTFLLKLAEEGKTGRHNIKLK